MNADPTCAFALHDADTWTRECEYIERLADRPIRNLAAFLDYCAGQRDLAADRGFSNARVRIQQTINSLYRNKQAQDRP